MKAFRYTLTLFIVCAMTAPVLFAQRTSSAVQLVTFSVKRTHTVVSLAVEQQVADNGGSVEGNVSYDPRMSATEGDRAAVPNGKLSLSASSQRNAATDVHVVPSLSPSFGHKTLQTQTSDFGALRNRTAISSSDQLVMTVTD